MDRRDRRRLAQLARQMRLDRRGARVDPVVEELLSKLDDAIFELRERPIWVSSVRTRTRLTVWNPGP